MATFRGTSVFQFTFINHSTSILLYDLTELTDRRYFIRGSVKPRDKVVSPAFQINNFETLEKGNISSVIAMLGAPNPSFRFWSGGFFRQYINLLGESGYVVTKDTSEISKITGNGAKITVDGGGVKDPSVQDIYIQVYNA